MRWGSGASPIVYKNLVIVNAAEESESLRALDKKTGKQLWRVERDQQSNWATPYVWQNEKRTELIVPGRKKVCSYDLDGQVLWELGGMSSIVIPTPFAGHGLLFLASGYVGDSVRPVFAVRPGARGDISLKDGVTGSGPIAWYLPQFDGRSVLDVILIEAFAIRANKLRREFGMWIL